MEHEEIRVDGKRGVSVAAEIQEMKCNAGLADLNFIVAAIQKQLQILPPIFKGHFMGLVTEQDEECEFTLQQKTQENFRSVKVPEIERVWVHKDYVDDF